MECVVLVDNSNVFIEARKLSAVRKGVTGLTLEGKVPQDRLGVLIENQRRCRRQLISFTDARNI
jgi:hypothetical protein